MPETEPCPAKEANTEQLCLTADFVDELYDRIDTMIDNANVHILADQGIPLLNTTDSGLRITLDPAHKCIEYNDWTDMYTFIETAIATGRVPKYMYDDSHTQYPDPVTPDDVAIWEGCEGYWNSLDEVYACLDCTCPEPTTDPPDRIDDNYDGCLTKCMMNCFWLVLNCLASGKCYPDCECPICSPGICEACANCVTLAVDVDSDSAARLLEVLPKEAGSNSCRTWYDEQSIALRDDDGVPTGGLLDFTMYVTANDLYFKIGVYEPVANLWAFSSWHTTHGSDDPEATYGCVTWAPLEVPVFEDNINLYWQNPAPDWTFSKQAYVVLYFGPPVDHPYFSGMTWDYQILDVTDIDVVECGVALPGLWDGTLTGGGPWTYAGPHKDMSVSARLYMDDTVEFNYVLEIKCLDDEGHETIIWEGSQYSCGGPAGLYEIITGTGPTTLRVNWVEPTP